MATEIFAIKKHADRMKHFVAQVGFAPFSLWIRLGRKS